MKRTNQIVSRCHWGLMFAILALGAGGESIAATPNRIPKFLYTDLHLERNENTTFVIRAKAVDPDRDVLTYRIVSGADSQKFSVVSSTGDVNFLVAPDWDIPGDLDGDNTYELAVEADDGKGGTASQSITVTIMDVGDNVPPVFTLNNGNPVTLAIAENNAEVLTLTATDPDRDTLSYSISGGEDATAFRIDSGSGALRFVSLPDWDNPTDLKRDNVYKVRVAVSDGMGGRDLQNVTVTVQNAFVNVPPVISPAGDALVEVLAHQTGPDDMVYQVVATDGDRDSLTYSLIEGIDRSYFVIDTGSGELFFASERDVDEPQGSEEDGNTYVVQVSVADGNGGSVAQTVRVHVVDGLDPVAPITSWILPLHGIPEEGSEPVVPGPGSDTGAWPRVIRGISADAEGGVYLGGSFFGRTWLGETELASVGVADILAARLDGDGQPLWVRRFGSRGTDMVPDVATDGEGAALLTGMYSNGTDFDGLTVSTLGGSDAFTAKLSPQGEVLWVSTVGGAATDSGNEVCADGDGNVLVVGNSEGAVTAGATSLPHGGGMDSFVLKYNAGGQLLWAQAISGGADEQGRGIAADPAGNVVVVGEFAGTIQLGAASLTAASAQRDVFVAKYSPRGELLWAQRFGDVGEDYARGVGTDAQGRLYVTGVFSGDVAFGSTVLHAAAGREQLFLMRLSGTGQVEWVQGFTGTGQGHGCEIEVSTAGDSVLACDVMGELQVGDRTVASPGAREGIVARFSADGSVQWVKTLGAGDESFAFALALDPSGEQVTAVGAFNGTLGNDGYHLTSVTDSSSYVVRLDQTLTQISEDIDDLSTYTLGQDGPYTVDEIELTLPAQGWPEPMPLRFYVPAGAGPFPVVFFVSGSSGLNDTYPKTSRYLASHGYLVIHNSYTRNLVSLEAELSRYRAEGVSFVLDSLYAIEGMEPRLAGKFDTLAIGAMGHSSGAFISQLVGGATVVWNGVEQSLYDPRILAVAMYSGQGRDQQGTTEASWDDIRIPMLQITGTEDDGYYGQDPSWRWDPFLLGPSVDKYLVWSYGGHHGSLSGDFIIDPVSEARFQHGKVMTLAFWDAYLKQNTEALEFLRSKAPTSIAEMPLDFLSR